MLPRPDHLCLPLVGYNELTVNHQLIRRNVPLFHYLVFRYVHFHAAILLFLIPTVRVVSESVENVEYFAVN